MNKRVILFLLVGLAAFAGCKKDKADNTPDPVPTTGTALDKMKDSVFLYAKEDYYWYDALPDYTTFDPRSVTGSTDLIALQTEVNKLSQYKINPATSKPYEYTGTSGAAKYSFIDAGEASNRLSGVVGDFGFGLLYYSTTDLRIKYVYPGSPADVAGIKRGYRVTAINGRTALTYDGANGANLTFVNNAFTNSSTISMSLTKYDGSTLTINNMNTSSYTINPVITYKVITVDTVANKKVGYIVFNSFVSLASAQPKLDAAFSYFKTNGITDLVVDLRYDGGGYVETAEYLDNLIAPPSVNNLLMYTTYYNDILAANKEQLLKNQVRKDDAGQTYNYNQVDYSVARNQVKFGTAHQFNLSRVFFLVTSGTASASELTINNLRPYMDVKLIGSTTYGKPVGFFDIKINKYTMYIPEFETKNSLSQGGYYTGMVPGSTTYPGYVAYENLQQDFGDPSDPLLASALNYIKKGTYVSSATSIQSLSATKDLSVEDQATGGFKLDVDKFKGMVFKTLKHK